MVDMESLNKQQIDFLEKRFDSLEKRVDEGFSKMSTELKILSEGYIRRETFENHCKEAKDTYVTKEGIAVLTKEVEGLVSDRQWAVRIILGIIITAIVGTVVIVIK